MRVMSRKERDTFQNRHSPFVDNWYLPFHVAPLGTAKGHDALASEHVERKRVNALLVDNDKRLVSACASQIGRKGRRRNSLDG